MDKKKIEEILRLYSEGVKTKKIRELYGIGSQDTLYKILHANHVKRPIKRSLSQTVCFDQEAREIIRAVNPDNLSAWICDLIKKSQMHG
jgi:hypothetical protein